MPQAARINDSIGHSPTMSWLLKGLLIGAAIAVAGVVVAGTGGLAAAAIVGGLAAGGAGLGEVFSTMSWAPKDVCGLIKGACSPNVMTNGRNAARAHIDVTVCSKHGPVPPPIATGSANVFINGLPAARVNDTISCGAVITSGSNNVFIGGGTVQTDQISPEGLVPAWVHAALLAAGLASGVVLGGWAVALGALALGLVGGTAGEWLGGKLFGENSDGQKWAMLAGAFAGGVVGAKGGPKAWNFAKRIEITQEPGTLDGKAYGAKGGASIENAVLGRMRTGSATKTDPLHSFPDMVDNYVGDAAKFSIPTKGPGGVVIRQSELYQVEGGLNSKQGIFEWIVDQGEVTHRRFIPNGQVTGFPNQVPPKP